MSSPNVFGAIKDTLCVDGVLNHEVSFTMMTKHSPHDSFALSVPTEHFVGDTLKRMKQTSSIEFKPAVAPPLGSGSYGVIRIYDVHMYHGFNGQVAVKLMSDPGETKLSNVCTNPCKLIPILTHVDWYFPRPSGEIVYVAIMPIASGDLTVFKKHNLSDIGLGIMQRLKDRIVIFQSIREQLLCLSLQEQYYLDVKAENILFRADSNGKVRFYLGDIGSVVPNAEGDILATYPPFIHGLDDVAIKDGFVSTVKYDNDALVNMVSYTAGIFLMELLDITSVSDLQWNAIQLRSNTDYISKVVVAIQETRDLYGDKLAEYVSILIRRSGLADTYELNTLLWTLELPLDQVY